MKCNKYLVLLLLISSCNGTFDEPTTLSLLTDRSSKTWFVQNLVINGVEITDACQLDDSYTFFFSTQDGTNRLYVRNLGFVRCFPAEKPDSLNWFIDPFDDKIIYDNSIRVKNEPARDLSGNILGVDGKPITPGNPSKIDTLILTLTDPPAKLFIKKITANELILERLEEESNGLNVNSRLLRLNTQR